MGGEMKTRWLSAYSTGKESSPKNHPTCAFSTVGLEGEWRPRRDHVVIEAASGRLAVKCQVASLGSEAEPIVG